MNDPKVEKQPPVPPFVQFVCSAVPMVFDNSMSYYEALCALWKYLDETVKVINNNATVTEEFIQQVNELHAYVENYFENLNVQAEIDHKLDEMATSGQLQSLIAEYFSAIQAEVDGQNTEIANFKTSVNGEIAVQDGKISTLESRMDSFTNLTEGSTTGDAELIDGRTSFTGRVSSNIGGNIRTYQGVSYTDITSTLTKVDNKFISNSLAEQDSNEYEYYTLATEKGKIYFIDVNSDGSKKQIVMGYGNENCYPYPAVSVGTHDTPYVIYGTGGTIYINNLKSYTTPYIGVLETKSFTTKSYSDISASLTEHTGYVTANGDIATTSGFNYYTFTPKKGHKYLIYTETGGGQAPLVYQEDGNIYPDDSGSYSYQLPIMFEYYCVNESTLYVNYRSTRCIGSVVVLESNNSYTTGVENVQLYPMVGLFNKAVFIGDSLTYGQTYISDTAPRSYRNNVNYPKTLQKLAQIDNITEIAQSGATSTSWWEQFNTQITEENAVYFVWLGTNDTFTDTVATDCAGDDYTQYAQTETGDFGRILGKIKSLSGTKIVLLNQFANNARKTTNNKVINDLATKFGATVIDTDKAIVQQNGYHTAYNEHYNATHMNNQGYALIANLVFNQMNDYLNNNPGSYELYSLYQ